MPPRSLPILRVLLLAALLLGALACAAVLGGRAGGPAPHAPPRLFLSPGD